MDGEPELLIQQIFHSLPSRSMCTMMSSMPMGSAARPEAIASSVFIIASKPKLWLPQTDGALLYGVRQLLLAAGHLAVSVGKGVAVGACEDLSVVDVGDKVGALLEIGYNMRGNRMLRSPFATVSRKMIRASSRLTG